MSPAAHDALLLLLPLPEFVALMWEVLRKKWMRGDEVPSAWSAWLLRVQDIRQGHLVPVVACLTDEEWKELSELEF